MPMFEKPVPKKPNAWAEGSVTKFRVVSRHMANLVSELRSTRGGTHFKVKEALFGVDCSRALAAVFVEIGRRADEAARLWEEKDLTPLIDEIVELVRHEMLTCEEKQRVRDEVMERCG